MGKRGEPMLNFFLILNEIVMKLIHLVMWYVDDLSVEYAKQDDYLHTGTRQLVLCFSLPEKFSRSKI